MFGAKFFFDNYCTIYNPLEDANGNPLLDNYKQPVYDILWQGKCSYQSKAGILRSRQLREGSDVQLNSRVYIPLKWFNVQYDNSKHYKIRIDNSVEGFLLPTIEIKRNFFKSSGNVIILFMNDTEILQ